MCPDGKLKGRKLVVFFLLVSNLTWVFKWDTCSQRMGLHYPCIFHPWPDHVSLKLTLVSFFGYDFLDIYSRTLQTMRSLMKPQYRDPAQVPAFSVHTPLVLLQLTPPGRIEQLKLKVPLLTSSMITDFYVWEIRASGGHLFNKEAIPYTYMAPYSLLAINRHVLSLL